MKSDPTFWILARTSGLVAYALLTASVLAGLVLKSRPFGSALKPALVTDLHRFLALLGLGALSLHGLGARPRSHRADLDRRPARARARALPAALDRARRARGRTDGGRLRLLLAAHADRGRNWRRLHWATYLIFALATLHGLAAGTDSGTPWALGALRRRGRRRPRRHRLARTRPTRKGEHVYRIEIDRSLCSGFGICADCAAQHPARRRRPRRRRRGRDRRDRRPRGRRRLPDGRDHRLRAERRPGRLMPRRVLILGAGLAGSRCAQTLRAEGSTARSRWSARSSILPTSGPRSPRSSSPAPAASSTSSPRPTGRTTTSPSSSARESNGSRLRRSSPGQPEKPSAGTRSCSPPAPGRAACPA